MKDTKGIIDIAYPEVEKNIKQKLPQYKKYLSQFINSRADQLYSNSPCKQIYFTQYDVDDFFKFTNINPSIIKQAIDNTYYSDIANFNPRYAKDECTVALLCLVRYFKLKNMKKELELAMLNMAFSGKYYPSIFYASFPVTTPQEQIMEYVVTHMCSNKYDIVREGNVIGAIKSICNTWVNSYNDKFRDFHDDDCVYLIQQLHNRIKSFMNNIAELYYEAYENKDYITYDSDDVSEDNYHLADSDMFKLQRIVEATMNRINTKGIDYRVCKMASSDLVKVDELKSIIENLLSDPKNTPMIKEFISLQIACYFKQSSTKDVRDMSFIAYCIRPKSNAKDKYILRQKELLDIILVNNSEHFLRRKNRNATAQAYYRSINMYFALTIQEAMK